MLKTLMVMAKSSFFLCKLYRLHEKIQCMISNVLYSFFHICRSIKLYCHCVLYKSQFICPLAQFSVSNLPWGYTATDISTGVVGVYYCLQQNNIFCSCHLQATKLYLAGVDPGGVHREQVYPLPHFLPLTIHIGQGRLRFSNRAVRDQ